MKPVAVPCIDGFTFHRWWGENGTLLCKRCKKTWQEVYEKQLEKKKLPNENSFSFGFGI